MTLYTIEQLLELETAVWTALASGDKEADTRLLADNFLGVYPSGFAVKADHTGQLQNGPTIATYTLSEAKLMSLAENVVLLSYRADYTRRNGSEIGELETMYISSIWQKIDDEWKNVFSQDTLAES